jgi:hypothetical protein
MDKRKTAMVTISIIIVLVASIPFPGLYALWGFLAFAWLVGRIKTEDSSNNTAIENKSE